MPTTHRPSLARLGATALAAVAVAASLAACERDPSPTATVAAPVESAAPDATASPTLDEQCAAAEPLLRGSVPREYIGSDEHVAHFDAMIKVAPADLLPNLELVRDHYADDVSPANPDSQDFPNFPPPIQEAALALSAELSALCAGV